LQYHHSNFEHTWTHLETVAIRSLWFYQTPNWFTRSHWYRTGQLWCTHMARPGIAYERFLASGR